MKLAIFWLRRDLRLDDNTALHHALKSGLPVLPVFIFDQEIIDEHPADDARISFIYQNLSKINRELISIGSSIRVFKGEPLQVWKKILQEYEVREVYINKDYEPYAIERDRKIKELLHRYSINLHAFKDQVVYEGSEILKKDGNPYTVFTPYKKKWMSKFESEPLHPLKRTRSRNFYTWKNNFPTLKAMGFRESPVRVRNYDLSLLDQYALNRDFPGRDSTSYLSPHLRFGTISIRQVIHQLGPKNDVFLSELIWREFFMQILYHFPEVVTQNFHSKYDNINWINNEKDFEKWCKGNTGYPLVDAGMRQLNASGYMHNRVRMVTASFLCKHLLIDWRWGEAYFAKKLLDFELSSNNGNWQWAAGTGCDAAPYFRVFNPETQQKKFDKEMDYIKKWIPEYGTSDYPDPIVEHKFARSRALETYKKGIKI